MVAVKKIVDGEMVVRLIHREERGANEDDERWDGDVFLEVLKEEEEMNL
jgi:hypothetical protein